MTIFFVNPMGYGSLGFYDSSIINNLPCKNVTYFTNIAFNLELRQGSGHRIYQYSGKKLAAKALSYLFSQYKLIKEIHKASPDIVHFQWFKIPRLDYLLVKFLKKRGVKTVITAHNILPHDSGDRYFGIYKKIYTAIDSIIVHASITKDELVETFGIEPDKIKVIPHGILQMQRSEQQIIDRLKDTLIKDHKLQGKLIFSLLGSINKYKGIELVIETWKSLGLSRDSRLHLLIAGNGMAETLETLQGSEHATIINRFLSNDEFVALVQVSDFILLPYLKISQSGVLFTALNEKKRIIVSKKGGLTEPFRFGPVGYILEDLTVAELSKTINKASRDDGQEPAEALWQQIHRHYDWRSIGQMTFATYEGLLGRDIQE